MIKKILSALVIMSFLCFSTGYAYDSEDDHNHDQTVNIAAIVAVAVVTVFFLIVTHDRHGGYGGPGGGHGRHGHSQQYFGPPDR